jgi:hypothetical protein
MPEASEPKAPDVKPDAGTADAGAHQPVALPRFRRDRERGSTSWPEEKRQIQNRHTRA